MSDSTHSVSTPAAEHEPAVHDDHSPEEIKKHMKRYITVFVLLLILTAVTVGVSYIPLGTKGNVTVALFIAIFKASLVAGFFMHLVSEKWTIYRFMIMTILFFLGLMFLSILAFNNPIAR